MKIKLIDKIILIIILVSLVVILFLNKINNSVTPILKNYANSETTMLTTYIINESINEVKKSISFNDLIKTNIVEDSITLDFDNNKINDILYLTTEKIQNKIKTLEHKKYEDFIKYDYEIKENGIIYNIPVLVILGNSILSSLGPKIPVSSSLIGDVKTNVKLETSDYGINNSLVKLIINIEMSEEVILPFSTDKLYISKDIIIGMKIINGKIPSYYGGYMSSSIVNN